MSDNNTTTVLSQTPDSNVVTMVGVDMLKSGAVNQQGRIYLAGSLGGEEVEYALKANGEIRHMPTSEDIGEVELIDVDEIDHSKILSNGQLHVGKEYADSEVVVAVRVVENTKNIDEKNTTKPTVHG